MVPAQQGLEGRDLVVGEVELRLVVELELPLAQRHAHVVLELVACAQAFVQLALEEAGVAGAVLLGAAVGEVGVLQELVGVLAVVGTDRDAEVDGDRHRLLVDVERCAEHLMQALDQGVRRLERLVRQLQDDELVAADARQHVDAFEAAAQALRHGLQQRVSDRRPVRVVDLLEPIDLEQNDDEVAPLERVAAQCLIHAFAQLDPIGQVGQRIVEGLVAHPFLLRLAMPLFLGEAALVVRQHELHHQPDQRHCPEHPADDLALARAHALDKIGDVAVDLEHRLHRRGLVQVHRDVGADDVALGDRALPGVEPVAVGDLAGRVAVARAPESRVRGLVLADLARVGGKNRQAPQIVDLHLHHAQAVRQQPQLRVEALDLRPAGKLARGQRPGLPHERRIGRPDGVGEHLGQADAGLGLGLHQRVHHQATVKQRQGHHHGDQHRDGDNLRIAQEIQHPAPA